MIRTRDFVFCTVAFDIIRGDEGFSAVWYHERLVVGLYIPIPVVWAGLGLELGMGMGGGWG